MAWGYGSLLYPLSINSQYISLSTNAMNIQWFSQSRNNRHTRRGLYVAMLVEINHNHGKPKFTLKELFYIRSCQVASSPVCSTIILLSWPDSTLLKDVIARIFISITARTDATLRRAADTNFGDYGGTFCIIYVLLCCKYQVITIISYNWCPLKTQAILACKWLSLIHYCG